jgi:putative ATPase
MFIANTFRKRGFTVKIASQEIKEKRRITPTEIEKWFDTESSAYGSKMCQVTGGADLQKIVNLLLAACSETVFDWKSEISFLTLTKANESVN